MSVSLTEKEVLKRFRKVHGDTYGYSKFIYKHSKKKSTIICKLHGKFEQSAGNHFKGRGCRQCSIIRRGNIRRWSKESFIKKSKLIYGDTYDYSKFIYSGARNKGIIICKIHGEYQQAPHSHTRLNRPSGCPECSHVRTSKKLMNTTKYFIKSARAVHGNVYDYSKVYYSGCKIGVEIVCLKHGAFIQQASSHLNGRGCPICLKSRGERAVSDTLVKKNIGFNQQYKFKGCRDKRELLFDFYLSEFNACIEYDGEQHFLPVVIFGGKDGFKKTKKRDKIKNDFCKKNSIPLLRIPYTEENIENKIILFIKHLKDSLLNDSL